MQLTRFLLLPQSGRNFSREVPIVTHIRYSHIISCASRESSRVALLSNFSRETLLEHATPFFLPCPEVKQLLAIVDRTNKEFTERRYVESV